ncbi:MAG TPA: RsmE family RNA methyltransferase [Gemmatimonadaceae bacterium]|nr:RsmE family RNA methyltransferase [Gemmatimonadaceae bacterium]
MSLPTFVTDEPFGAPSTVTLGEESAHHMRVRRLETGARVGLLDGAGVRGEGVLTQLAKRHATVSVDAATLVTPPAEIHLMLPVADRDRMLWLAEKATELQVASWRPVVYKRSRHVTPRGEGTTFQQKARSRMVSALEQSGGAWLPVMFPDATVEHAIAARPEGVALVLEAGSPGVLEVVLDWMRGSDGADMLPPVTLAVGPEGGYEEGELAALTEAGFRRVALGGSILRFETAALAGVAAVRAALMTREQPA